MATKMGLKVHDFHVLSELSKAPVMPSLTNMINMFGTFHFENRMSPDSLEMNALYFFLFSPSSIITIISLPKT